ncbi:5912_t:CDS:1, partial [Diversispora eburnea]
TEPAKDTQDAKFTISPTPTDFGSLKKETELITCGDDDNVEGGTGFDTP